MKHIGLALIAIAAVALAACTASAVPQPSPSPSATPSESPTPSPTPTDAAPTVAPGTTPFPTPGPTITPGSTRVIGTIRHADGSPAAGICVVIEKGLCPIGTDDQGVWFTDIPSGPLNWNFIYKLKVDGAEAGRQLVLGTTGGELRLPVYTLTD
ncbi:MAG TPA: hypothetical protein VIN70_04995 [Candidatus Limnocylindria bacterium]